MAFLSREHALGHLIGLFVQNLGDEGWVEEGSPLSNVGGKG